MRIIPLLAGFAACILAPPALAQAAEPLPAPILTAIITVPGTAEPQARVRNRPASAMADFYPIDGTEFHLSAGLRFFESRSMLRQNLKAMRDLVYLPRSVGNSGVHWGYRRVPAMAVGYTQSLDKDVTLGIEVGAMLGRATGSMRRFGQGGERRREGGGPNSIVHLVFGVGF